MRLKDTDEIYIGIQDPKSLVKIQWKLWEL